MSGGAFFLAIISISLKKAFDKGRGFDFVAWSVRIKN